MTGDCKIYAVPESPGWAHFAGRPWLAPGVVAIVLRGGRPFTLGPEAVREVRAWIESVGWRPGEAPVRLVPTSDV